MKRIYKELHNLSQLPATFEEIRNQLQYHTESGLSLDEASAYAQQLNDIKEILVPAWQTKLGNTDYFINLECIPQLNGFIKIKITKDKAEPVEVFTESYTHFNAGMCDGSCYQYVYQRVICYKEGLETKRVNL